MRGERPGAWVRHSFHARSGPASPPPIGQAPRSPILDVAVVGVRGLLATEVSSFDCGFLDGYVGDGSIVAQAREADADPSIGALVFDFLSPGGDALGCGEAAAQLAALRAASQKPWLVYARQACSAAYYLATAAAGEGGLFVSESSDVGSIGTWLVHENLAQANKDDGIEYTYVEDPPGKVAGNPDEPPSEEALARFQRDVSEATTRFCEAVASRRPQLTAASLRALRGDTRRGAAAVSEGLADGLATSLEEVIALAFQWASSPASSPAPSGAMTPLAKGSAVKASAALVVLVPGLSADASPAAVEAAALPLLRLASVARSVAGTEDPEAAAGVLRAHAALAGEVPSLRAKLAEDGIRAEEIERVHALEAAVKEGLLKPAEVWTWSEPKDGGKAVRGVAPIWAAPNGDGIGKTMKALRAELAHLRAVGPRTLVAGADNKEKEPDANELAANAALSALTPEQLQYCAAHRLDPVKFAALHVRNFGAVGAAR
jgi:capsid assembly protease